MKFRDNWRDWVGASVIILIGAAVVKGGLDYKIGSLSRMGPGYFPLMLGVLLLVVGVLLLVGPLTRPAEEGATPWKPALRPWLAVIGSLLAFMVLGKYGGLVPATFLMVLIAALGDANNRLKEAAVLAALVTVFAVGLFHFGLQMQFPLFSWG